jgi:membrane complex biogenesis BtpA family protein
MVHVPALPGAPRWSLEFDSILRFVLRDAVAWRSAGVDALMIENYGDVPFFPDSVPAHVVAYMTVLAREVRARTGLPIGVNVLRNDAVSALSIAAAVGAGFIRVNVLSGSRVTDQGLIQSRACEVLRLRSMLGATNVAILADVDVKHSAPLAQVPVETEVADLLHRALADGLIVSGTGTGQPTSPRAVARVREAAGAAPILVGSGVNVENCGDLLDFADGLIVGTSVKIGGAVEAPVDPKRAEELVRAVRAKVKSRRGLSEAARSDESHETRPERKASRPSRRRTT